MLTEELGRVHPRPALNCAHAIWTQSWMLRRLDVARPPPSWSIELMFLICHTLSRVCPCLQISSAGRVEAVNSIEHYLCMLCHFLYPWNLSNNVEIWDSHGDHVGFTKGSRDFPADSSCGGVFGPAGCGTQRKGRSRSNFFCPLGSMITRFVCRMLPSDILWIDDIFSSILWGDIFSSGVLMVQEPSMILYDWCIVHWHTADGRRQC